MGSSLLSLYSCPEAIELVLFICSDGFHYIQTLVIIHSSSLQHLNFYGVYS